MQPRTYLFVPGNRPERFGKALACGADAVVLDLEDAVSHADKERARGDVGQHLANAAPAERARLVVRINGESTPWFDDDLQMLQRAGALQVMLPKAERVATVARLRSACPGIAVLALIETARVAALVRERLRLR